MSEPLTKVIPLSNRSGEVVAQALVDAADYDALSGFQWRISSAGYAVRWKDHHAVLMHRVIMQSPPDRSVEVDHINRNRLDNRRRNLCHVSHAENMQNRPPWGKTSQYRGVYWHARKQRWAAKVNHFGKHYHFGYFVDELVAAQAAADGRARLLPGSDEARAVQC